MCGPPLGVAMFSFGKRIMLSDLSGKAVRSCGRGGRLLTEQGKAVAYHYETASVCLVLVINSLFFHIQIYEIFM